MGRVLTGRSRESWVDGAVNKAFPGQAVKLAWGTRISGHLGSGIVLRLADHRVLTQLEG